MYFATLTEVPILQGLLGAGMGQGPALALLLAGPALSLPACGDRQHYGGKKNGDILRHHRDHVHHCRHGVWMGGRISFHL